MTRTTHKNMDELFPQRSSDACRVCNEPVVDGRWNYCSERCRRVARTVQRMFSWDSVKRRVLRRDDHTCQECGLSKEMAVRAHWQMDELARERVDELKDINMDAWRIQLRSLRGDYGCDEYPEFEVDHITPVSDGGALFDEANLQTLCKPCHDEKTSGSSDVGADVRPAISISEYEGAV